MSRFVSVAVSIGFGSVGFGLNRFGSFRVGLVLLGWVGICSIRFVLVWFRSVRFQFGSVGFFKFLVRFLIRIAIAIGRNRFGFWPESIGMVGIRSVCDVLSLRVPFRARVLVYFLLSVSFCSVGSVVVPSFLALFVCGCPFASLTLTWLFGGCSLYVLVLLPV